MSMEKETPTAGPQDTVLEVQSGSSVGTSEFTAEEENS